MLFVYTCASKHTIKKEQNDFTFVILSVVELWLDRLILVHVQSSVQYILSIRHTGIQRFLRIHNCIAFQYLSIAQNATRPTLLIPSGKVQKEKFNDAMISYTINPTKWDERRQSTNLCEFIFLTL